MACHLLYFIRQSKKSMKNKMIIVCVLLGLVLPLDGQTTLDDCIHYAWKHNLEFKNTQIEVQEAHTMWQLWESLCLAYLYRQKWAGI